MSARHAVLATVLLAGVVVGLRAGSPGDAGTRTEPEPAGRTGGRPAGVPGHARAAIVASITDGDTLRVEIGGANAPVRLLELDTPETAGACGASEATAALARLAPVGSRVWLEADVEDRDRYGRLLRYLWRDDGTMVNDALVRQGWARAVLYPPNDRHWPLLRQAEREAAVRVLRDDPHRLDGDGDGIGCEPHPPSDRAPPTDGLR